MNISPAEFLALKIFGIVTTILLAWSVRKYYSNSTKEVINAPKGSKTKTGFKRFIYGQPFIMGGVLLFLVVVFALLLWLGGGF